MLLASGDLNVSDTITDDPYGEGVLACTAQAGTDLIRNADRHLLALGNYQNLSGLSMRELLEQLGAGDG